MRRVFGSVARRELLHVGCIAFYVVMAFYVNQRGPSLFFLPSEIAVRNSLTERLPPQLIFFRTKGDMPGLSWFIHVKYGLVSDQGGTSYIRKHNQLNVASWSIQTAVFLDNESILGQGCCKNTGCSRATAGVGVVARKGTIRLWLEIHGSLYGVFVKRMRQKTPPWLWP